MVVVAVVVYRVEQCEVGAAHARITDPGEEAPLSDKHERVCKGGADSREANQHIVEDRVLHMMRSQDGEMQNEQCCDKCKEESQPVPQRPCYQWLSPFTNNQPNKRSIERTNDQATMQAT